VPTKLSILSSWPLSKLRGIFEKHEEMGFPMDVTKEHFRILLGFDKDTSEYLFTHLAQIRKRNKTERLLKKLDYGGKCPSSFYSAGYEAFDPPKPKL
jgi:hypothetical protein